MERKRFSSDELYLLRNEIPLVVLIQKGLDIPSHARHGRFCFQCPFCEQFNTAVNPQTNLAKCFGCQKIFNTIDLVMEVRQTDFVESVRFLRNFYGSISAGKKPPDYIPKIDHKVRVQPDERAPQKRTPCHGPEHIGQILNGLITSRTDASSDRQPEPTQKNGKMEDPEYQRRNARFLELERKVDHLSLQIEKIIKLIGQNLPSS